VAIYKLDLAHLPWRANNTAKLYLCVGCVPGGGKLAGNLPGGISFRVGDDDDTGECDNCGRAGLITEVWFYR